MLTKLPRRNITGLQAQNNSIIPLLVPFLSQMCECGCIYVFVRETEKNIREMKIGSVSAEPIFIRGCLVF